jgi:gluconokinase
VRVPDRFVFVVMGVSGSGKTTIGEKLAERLGWEYAEADEFHPAANVEKMAAGIPLSDEDRWPWLQKIAARIDARIAARAPAVVTCSALKRSYRDVLRRREVQIVHLDGTYELIAARLAARRGHFFRPELLASQFAALEPPAPDEGAIVVSIDDDPDAIVDRILADAGNPLASSPGP